MFKTRELVFGAILTSLALMIPLVFRGFLQVYIPPFSATLASHVPSMLAMFISPTVAVIVGIGSTLGFLITIGPVIASRAAVHIAFALIGALLYRKGFKPWQVLLLTLPIHGIGEALVVMPFGFDLYSSLVTVGLGTMLHHGADAFLALTLYQALAKAGINFSKLIPVHHG